MNSRDKKRMPIGFWIGLIVLLALAVGAAFVAVRKHERNEQFGRDFEYRLELQETEGALVAYCEYTGHDTARCETWAGKVIQYNGQTAAGCYRDYLENRRTLRQLYECSVAGTGLYL